jgi:putative nucleotidyltransferase with HDIG domain
MIRLGLVLATTCIVTIFVFSWGEPFTYRLGEVHPSDLRVRVYFETVNQPQTELKREEAVKSSPREERRDPVTREEIRRGVPPVVEKYPPGMPLVYRGQAINEKQLSLLQEEHRAYVRSLTFSASLRRGFALFLVFSLLAAVVVIYVARFQPALAQSAPKISAICLLVIVTILLVLILSPPPWHALLIPLTTTAMILTIVYNPQFALLMSFSLALATTVALGTGLNHLLIQMGGLATAVLNLGAVRTRTKLVTVAAAAGAGYLAMTVATGLLSGQTATLIFFDAGRNLLWGTLAGFLLTGSLPLVERAFGIVTDIRLLELADGSHPLLQELVRRAPGTYTHSMTVATLAEPAAEAIGANPLLARVGSYFHDVGKMLKPNYFVENQTGENRHDALEPALSTLIIIGHVKDGIALAEQYRLPKPIIDCIQQHHGTTLVEYFYHEAIRLQEEAGHGSVELESSFRYPGPKPQDRENGIIMLADAVESASRSLSEPTPGSLRKLVHDLLMKRLLDGQFEECGMTLTELHQIEESLSKGLIAVYHSRIRYSEPPKSRAS